VVTFATIYGWFLEARRIKKPRLTVPPGLLIPGATVMELLMKDPPITPDEINMFGVNNIAGGIDSVSTHFGWRPTAPSSKATSQPCNALEPRAEPVFVALPGVVARGRR